MLGSLALSFRWSPKSIFMTGLFPYGMYFKEQIWHLGLLLNEPSDTSLQEGLDGTRTNGLSCKWSLVDPHWRECSLRSEWVLETAWLSGSPQQNTVTLKANQRPLHMSRVSRCLHLSETWLPQIYLFSSRNVKNDDLHLDSPVVWHLVYHLPHNIWEDTVNISPFFHYTSVCISKDKESLLHNHCMDIRSRKFCVGLDNSFVPKSMFRYCQLPPIMSFIAMFFLVQDSYLISLISFNLKRINCFKWNGRRHPFLACFCCMHVNFSNFSEWQILHSMYHVRNSWTSWLISCYIS